MRDHEGQVLGAMYVKQSIATNPFTAEAIRLFEAVLFCKNAGFSNLTLEGDAFQVVRILLSNFVDWSEGGCVINDSRQLLHSFTHRLVQHTPKNCNTMAHLLAKRALIVSSDVYLLDKFPECITNYVLLDAI